jgi:FkbM family methyltransferase
VDIVNKRLSTAIFGSRTFTRAFRALLRGLGRMAVASIEPADDEGFLRVRMRGMERIFYWPAELGTESLFIIAQEQGYSWNPHNYEIPQTRVRADDVVLDCGASEGLFSLRIVDRSARVILVEPLELFIRCLERTFAGLDRATIVRAALSDRCGTALLEENGIASKIGGGKTGTPTEMITVDALCARLDVAPTYVKADLEGWEPAMIRGARELLSRHKPRLAITTYDDPGVVKALIPEIRACNPDYEIITKGVIPLTGAPFMLHAW